MLKKKNDRQPPQRLEEERYPNDYWLDEEDGGEDIPEPADSSKPVSGRLHSEPMVTGYEALERQRGVRRPNRKLTRRGKEGFGKGHRNMKRNFIKSMKKQIRKMRKKEAKLEACGKKQRNRQCVKQRKVQRKKEQFSYSTAETADRREEGFGRKR